VGMNIFGPIRLRDRDAIITSEGLIFRVLGYSHPENGYICDIEYAPSEIYRSENPRAFRSNGKNVFYKFYGDEGWRFLSEKYPKYLLNYTLLGRKVIGVRHEDIMDVRRPGEKLQNLIKLSPADDLIRSLQKVLSIFIEEEEFSLEDFGVFGSLLHGFHNPAFSDLDIIVYGRETLKKLRNKLSDLYNRGDTPLKNEFSSKDSIRNRVWRFKNMSPDEFLWHQRRKMIYGVFHDNLSGRRIKVEFEPVKSWDEISNDHKEICRIRWLGWVKAILRVTDDRDSPFMPSVYYVEPIKILEGYKHSDIRRIISYVEEFRMQCFRDEIVYAEGNLEEVEAREGKFHQITLTYGPRYYEQTLKTLKETF